MEIQICETRKEYTGQILELLHRDLSDFLPPKELFNKIWEEFSSQDNVYSLVALFEGSVIGYGALIIETKIRGGKRGHIEDIVADGKYRNKGVGSLIVNSLFEIAMKKGCYKVALQCKMHNLEFYEKCGFSKSGFGMDKFKPK